MKTTRPRRPPTPTGSAHFVWASPVAGVLVIVFIWYFVLNNLQRVERLHVEAATAETVHAAAMFEQQTQQLLADADRTTRLVKFEIEKHGWSVLAGLVRAGLVPDGGPIIVSVADARGEIIASNAPSGATEVAGRQSFVERATRDSGRLEIGRPATDRGTGREFIDLSRRLNRADGSFAGVVLVSVPVEVFAPAKGDRGLGKHGNLALLGLDGVYRARRGDASAPGGADGLAELLLARTQQVPNGSFEAGEGGDDRIVAYRVVDGFPLIATATMSKAEVLEQFAPYRREYVTARLALTLVVLAFFAIMSVLTARLQRNRRELNQQRHFLEHMVDNITSGIAVRSMRPDTFGRYVLWNESSTLLIGKPASEVLGRTVADVMTPEYAARIAELDRQMLASPMVQEATQTHESPGTAPRIFHTVRSPIFGEDGQVEFIVTSATDITAESRRADELELASRVFETTADGILLSDADDRVLMVNSAFTRLTGYAPDEMVGKSLADSPFRPLDKTESEGRMERLRLEGTLTSEVARVRKDGVPLSLWITASVVRNSDGSIRNHVRVFTDISLLKQTQQKLEQLASFDALTGLPNRRLLRDRMEQAIRRAERGDNGMAVMFVDLDDFKTVNDTLGHDVGDLLLTKVAQRLQTCIRSSDSIGRLGGDEFAIVLDDARDPAIPAQVGERILTAMSTPFEVGGHRLTAGASIGIATYPTDGTDATQLLRSADAAMYSAKHAGRNRYSFSSADTPKRAR